MHVLDLQQETIFITGETLETDLPKPREGLESDKNLKGNHLQVILRSFL